MITKFIVSDRPVSAADFANIFAAHRWQDKTKRFFMAMRHHGSWRASYYFPQQLSVDTINNVLGEKKFMMRVIAEPADAAFGDQRHRLVYIKEEG
jgi:hypothetical protein